jgi:hypothetical protein
MSQFELRLVDPDNKECTEKRRFCLAPGCKISYQRDVSTSTMRRHYLNIHASQLSISQSIRRTTNTHFNKQLAVNFALLNLPIHHVQKDAFRDLSTLLRHSDARLPHRDTLRKCTVDAAKQYRAK